MQQEKPTRTIRPSIAALLTLFGLGLGLFYAGRTRAAVIAAGGGGLISITLGLMMLVMVPSNGPIAPIAGLKLNEWTELSGFGASICFALIVWAMVARGPLTTPVVGVKRLWGYLAIWAIPFLCTVLVAFGFRVLAFQPFDVAAGSMRPTLEPGSVFVSEKHAYGYTRHSSEPFDDLFPVGRLFPNAPERGDIVTFRNPKDGLKTYVKRIVGMPGDEIRMVEGRLTINGEVVERRALAGVSIKCRFGDDGLVFEETLPNGVSYLEQECAGDRGRFDHVGPYRVPEGHYFMMGDNRDESEDSRSIARVGYVPFEYITGRVRVGER